MKSALLWVYLIGDLVTWVILAIEDWNRMSWWRWLFSVAIFDATLATIWPVYWAVIRPLFGS